MTPIEQQGERPTGGYQSPTDDLRAVTTTCSLTGRPIVVAIQRRWLVQDSPIYRATEKLPPDDRSRWVNHPHLPLCYFLVKSEWRALPAVDEAAAKDGQTPAK